MYFTSVAYVKNVYVDIFVFIAILQSVGMLQNDV